MDTDFVLQGWLTKESSHAALKRVSWNKHRRFCVIHGDNILRYYKKEGPEDCCGEIDLKRLEYIRISQHNLNHFELKERDSERIPYVFECVSTMEATHWVHTINLCRDSLSVVSPSPCPSPSPSPSPSPHSSDKGKAMSPTLRHAQRNDEDIVLEAFLCKKSRGRSLLAAAAATASNRWTERRFCIYFPEKVVVYFEGHSYRGEYKLDEHTTVTSVDIDEDHDHSVRRHVFELHNSSSGDILRCSADSDWRAKKWVEVITQIITGKFSPEAITVTVGTEVRKLGTTPSSSVLRRLSGMSITTKTALGELARQSPQCADCAAPAPTWASLNNGVLICTACSGVHRSLGVGVSFVQSLKLDAWTDDNIEIIRNKGPNDVANQELEFHVPVEYKKPTAVASRATRTTYITAKYATKLFAKSTSGSLEREKLAPIFSDEVIEASEKSIGEQEFIGILLVKLVGCTDLEKADFLGKSDPYVLLTTGLQTVKSKMIQNTLNPKFDETLMLSWDGNSPLIVQVMDHDKFKKHDPIGSLTIPLAEDENLAGAGAIIVTDRPLEGVSRGKISLEISFQRI